MRLHRVFTRLHRVFLPLEFKDDPTERDILSFDGEIEVKLANPKTGGAADSEGDADADEQDTVISGYGAIFNKEDSGGDIILPGAFKQTLSDIAKSGQTIPILWQHFPSQPIGVWDSLEEDSRGLKCSGTLFGELPQAQAARVLLKRKAVKGLSIGFRTQKSTIDQQTFVRSISQLQLFEISLVTFPMQTNAGVRTVKGGFQFPTEREMEKFYRDGGMSAQAAKAAVALTKKMVSRDGETKERPNRDGYGDLLKTIRKAGALLQR